MRLAMAHIDLARAEAAAIGGEIARVAALAGIAVAVVGAGLAALWGVLLWSRRAVTTWDDGRDLRRESDSCGGSAPYP